MKKKLYIVKHEVLAKNLIDAARIGVGVIYEVSIADEKYQPQDETKVEGYKVKTN